MRALQFEGMTMDLGKPLDWDEARDGPCETLPVGVVSVNGLPAFVSMWELEQGEVAKLLSGGKIRLIVVGTAHPPVGLAVLDAT